MEHKINSNAAAASEILIDDYKSKRTFVTESLKRNGKLTAIDAKTIAISVIESRHKELVDNHFSKTVEEIDALIEEEAKNGSLSMKLPVSSQSPTWYLRNELEEEYESRGFVFHAYDRSDSYNSICC